MRRVLLAIFLSIGPAWATDYTSCQSDLENLKRTSDDAQVKARDTASAQDDFEECQSSEDVRDCHPKLADYEDAKDSLESALEDLASKVHAVSSSCGLDLTRPVSVDPAKARYCRALNRQRMYLPPAALLSQCEKTMSEEECKKCLGIDQPAQ